MNNAVVIMNDGVYDFYKSDAPGQVIIEGFNPHFASLKHAPYVFIPETVTDFNTGITFNVAAIHGFSEPVVNRAGEVEISADNVRTIVVRDGIERITDFAFCDCKDLMHLYLPSSVIYIPPKSRDMFIGCPCNPVIHCPKGSKVEELAKKYGYEYRYTSQLKTMLHNKDEETR